MLSKLHSDEMEKHKDPELNMEKTTPYKRKGMKLKFSEHENECSSEESTKHNRKKIRILVKVVTVIKRKRKINLTKKYQENSKYQTSYV